MQIIIAKKKKKIIGKSIETLSNIRKHLRKEPIAVNLAKENGHDKDIFDGIPIEFIRDLKVTAKTLNGRIMLNTKLLFKPFKTIMKYVIHELVHVFQHIKNEGRKNKKTKDYLKNPKEQDAFSKQVEYQSREEGADSAIKYVKKLLDFHKVPKEDKKDIFKELTKEIG